MNDRHKNLAKDLILNTSKGAGDPQATMRTICLKYGGFGEILNGTDEYGNTALHNACLFNKKGCVTELVKTSGVNVNARNNSGETPLWIASFNCHLDSITSLFTTNIHTIDLYIKPHAGHTYSNYNPLEIAVFRLGQDLPNYKAVIDYLQPLYNAAALRRAGKPNKRRMKKHKSKKHKSKMRKTHKIKN
jgi:ankyrin repeat protein